MNNYKGWQWQMVKSECFNGFFIVFQSASKKRVMWGELHMQDSGKRWLHVTAPGSSMDLAFVDEGESAGELIEAAIDKIGW